MTRATIQIDKNLKPEICEEVKLHEVIEAINGSCDLGIDHRSLTMLSMALYQVLADNGPIKEWK